MLPNNSLKRLPEHLGDLRHLRILDVRCNLLKPDSLRLATTHCKRLGARLRPATKL